MDAQEQVGRTIIINEVDADDEASHSIAELVQGCTHERRMNLAEKL